MGKKPLDRNEFPNESGVFYSEYTNKYVVRMPNKSKSKGIKPFSSVAQYDDEGIANQKYQELTNQQ